MEQKILLLKITELVYYSFMVLIFLRIIFSWLFINRHSNSFSEFVYDFTDPLLKPFKVIIPMGGIGGLDLSPMLAIFALNLLKRIIINLIYNF